MRDPIALLELEAAAYDELADLGRQEIALKAQIAVLQAKRREVMDRVDALRGEREGLPRTKRLGKLGDMTSDQMRGRAQAISKASAKRSGDKFQAAVSKSHWGSANRYARERLGISPGMLTGYRNGTYPVPEHANAMIASDFGMKLPVKSGK